MSKQNRRPGREEAKQKRKQDKAARKALHGRQRSQGLEPRSRSTPSNCLSKDKTVEEETRSRQETVEAQVTVIRSQLPKLLARLRTIPDPRNPQRIKHKMTVVLLYGILMFVFQMSSRRDTNSKMSQPQFLENLKLLFPELETLPHNDTLWRLLSRIEVAEIEKVLADLVRSLIGSKKFRNYLTKCGYMIAIDGTQKFRRNTPWCSEAVASRTGSETEEGERSKQYSVYVLEANLVFANGLTLPLASEFIEVTTKEGEGSKEKDKQKQDCESKAFKRLAKIIKSRFPRLRIMVLLDGLYPNGPVFAICRRNNWDFMIVLQDKCLKAVWEEAHSLRKLDTNREHTYEQNWGDRRQAFWWVNDIEHSYGPNNRHKEILHLVVCEETWEEIEAQQVVRKQSRHAWVSRKPLTKRNVHERCNEGARHRWGVESSILVEKKYGYQSEHCFALDWEAMKGYHYLMRIAHLLNALANRTRALRQKVSELGLTRLMTFIVTTLSGKWLDPERIQNVIHGPSQLRLE